jgi:ferredoxin
MEQGSMGKLIFNDSGEEYTVQDGSPIAEFCEEAGVPFACTEGVCGTCVIEVKDGMENLTDFTQEEEDFLGEMANERLACQCKLKCGTVKITF